MSPTPAPKALGDNREVTPLDDFLAAFNRAIEAGRFSSLVVSKNLPAADEADRRGQTAAHAALAG